MCIRDRSEAALRKSEERFRKLLFQSRLLEKRLRSMTHEMLKVQEDQRKEISRELHDEVSQILLSINAVSYTHLDVYKRQAKDCVTT